MVLDIRFIYQPTFYAGEAREVTRSDVQPFTTIINQKIPRYPRRLLHFHITLQSQFNTAVESPGHHE